MTILESFEFLNLSFNSTEEEIKKAYRKKSMEYHPDKYIEETEKNEAHDKFVKLQEAYNNIINYKNSTKYDIYNFNDFKFYNNFNDFYNHKENKEQIEKVVNLDLYDFFKKENYSFNVSNYYESKEIAFPLNNSDFNRNYKGIINYKLSNVLYNPNNGNYDDLLFKVILKSNDNYYIHNSNLYFRMYIDPIDLILGGNTTIDFLDGNKIKYRISKCSKHNEVNKININDIVLFVEYYLIFPNEINEEQKESLLNYKSNQ